MTVRSKAVIVATGGFNSNLDMVLKFNPGLRNDKVLGRIGRGSTGSGHELLARRAAISPTWTTSGSTSTPRPTTATPRSAVVSCSDLRAWLHLGQSAGPPLPQRGAKGGNSASPALMAQSPRHAWAIMDAPMTATMEVADPYYRDGDKVVRPRWRSCSTTRPSSARPTPSPSWPRRWKSMSVPS